MDLELRASSVSESCTWSSGYQSQRSRGPKQRTEDVLCSKAPHQQGQGTKRSPHIGLFLGFGCRTQSRSPELAVGGSGWMPRAGTPLPNYSQGLLLTEVGSSFTAGSLLLGGASTPSLLPRESRFSILQAALRPQLSPPQKAPLQPMHPISTNDE